MPIFVGAALAAALFCLYAAFSLSRFRESAGAMEQTARELLSRLQSVEARLGDAEETIDKNLTAMRREQNENAAAGRAEQANNLYARFEDFKKQFREQGESQSSLIKEISKNQTESLGSFSNQLTGISRLNEEKLEAVRGIVEKKLGELQEGNEKKLEAMRATVDEKLQATLEKRLGDAFSKVSENLNAVQSGLGEMRALASGVGDLKKVLTNVKTRGTWGEMQLRALLEQILTKEQYAENVETKPGSGQRVEFAIALPGGEDGKAVYLPIDSKFPMEDYQSIVSASERGDALEIAEAQKKLRTRVTGEAKDIRDKYIDPPHTTDFGILYLPVEGLYAEVLRLDGLCESLAREYRVVPAGPTTICALLNSLQMGFRTLAIEKRSSEVWTLLGKVKTEFETFGAVLDKTRKKIDEARSELDKAGSRTRAINRDLKKVQELPVEKGDFQTRDDEADEA